MLVGQRSDFWPDRYPCYSCKQLASGHLLAEVDPQILATLSEVVDVTAPEAYAALHGLGLPSEQTCCAETVLPLFEQAGVQVVGGQVKGRTRFIIEELVFSDGTRLCLGSSPQGAVVYRIVRAHSYVKSVE